ncbi:methyltransferase domain-containing protein [uncultured Thiohalocapsa sp.]|uniref:methyltransferase domain-containing protein n=1 Tax=uncultured Thiohalocapsa sp. TaxID=768990 RepID=UPI0025F9CD9E|nr:methyltransferase domain-containing protein [uncultured Thiohalocapsa sp.]
MNRPDDWHAQADAYLAYFEDNPNRISSTRVFPRLLEHFGDLRGLRVLDFGCGQGRFARAMADAGAKVTAFDASSAEIANARALDQGRGIRYVERQQDLLDAGPFDRILCFMVLLCNDTEGADALLRMLYSLTAPGGRLGLANTDTATLGRRFPDFHSQPPAEPSRGATYRSFIPTSAGVMEVTDHYYSPEHLRAMLADAGFELRAEERVAEPFILHIAARVPA